MNVAMDTPKSTCNTIDPGIDLAHSRVSSERVKTSN